MRLDGDTSIRPVLLDTIKVSGNDVSARSESTSVLPPVALYTPVQALNRWTTLPGCRFVLTTGPIRT